MTAFENPLTLTVFNIILLFLISSCLGQCKQSLRRPQTHNYTQKGFPVNTAVWGSFFTANCRSADLKILIQLHQIKILGRHGILLGKNSQQVILNKLQILGAAEDRLKFISLKDRPIGSGT